MKKAILFLVVAFLSGFGALSLADEVALEESNAFIPLDEGKPFIHVMHDGRSVRVQRVQDPEYELRGYFARTGRKCPPFCLRPMVAAPGVETVGEIEVFAFMENELRDGQGLLIDARTPAWFQKGTIPGSINVPFNQMTKPISDPEMAAVLRTFGAKPREQVGTFTRMMEQWGIYDAQYKTRDWDFTDAKTLLLWCNGPFCGQSPRAIQGLIDVGYPTDKLLYYRGGLQVWQLFGLTTILPDR